MTIIVFALLGGALGIAIAGGTAGGFALGALGGALAGWIGKLSQRIDKLEHDVQALGRALQRAAPHDVPNAAVAPAERAADAPAERAVAPDSRTQTQPFPPRAGAPSAQAPPRSPAAAAQPIPPPAVVAPVPPRYVELEPPLIDKAIGHVVRWFTSGNVPVKVGVVLSVFGVGFLVKEGVDRHWLVLPIELRLALVALFGIALLVLGWRLRASQRVYALSVQGGGIAILYVTIYASFALFHLVPQLPAFFLLLVVTAGAGTLAVLQDSRALAVLGIVGGFMAPLLVSTGTGSHVALFSYYAILNVAIVGIAWFKAWRELNVLGFLFTFGIGALWGYQAYQPQYFATTEPFLILFVLMYLSIPVLFASRTRPELRGFVDGMLTFGTPIVGFGLQSQLVSDTEYGLAISALALAAVYVATATFLLKRGSQELRVLIEAQFALGVAFLTVAIPLALDARWTSAAWALQGAAMVWLGFRQRRRLALAAGVALQLMSGAAYTLNQPGTGLDDWPVLNGHWLGAFMLALAGAFSARLFDPAGSVAPLEAADLAAQREAGSRGIAARGARSDLKFPLLAGLLLIWGAGWWLYGGAAEIDRFVPVRLDLAAGLLFLCATTWIAVTGAGRFAWPRLDNVGLVLWAGAIPAALIAVFGERHPAQDLGWLAWPATIATMLSFLRARESRYDALRAPLHAAAYWILSALLVWETHWLTGRLASGIWPAAAALAVGTLLVLATVRMLDRLAWPLAANRETYLRLASGGVLVVLTLATIAINAASAGDAAPLPYLPILNPLELASVLNCIVLLRWLSLLAQSAPSFGMELRHRVVLAALFGLFLLTMIVARAVHHWAGVPFTPERLAASTVLQSSLSIVWGATGLAAMLIGARGKRRAVWIAGAALMGVVVVKLFLVELGDSGTLARIVSFLGVGVLLLVVGYFAPVPPRRELDERAA